MSAVWFHKIYGNFLISEASVLVPGLAVRLSNRIKVQLVTVIASDDQVS